MAFRIRGLEAQQFQHFVGLNDHDLQAQNARRVIADCSPGYPDRIELRDAEPGEALLLLNYEHQPAHSPYRASHAIFVLERAVETYDRIDQVPELLRKRMISLRAFDQSGMMIDAELSHGRELEGHIERLLQLPAAEYLQLHYAKQGCYACRVERVTA